MRAHTLERKKFFMQLSFLWGDRLFVGMYVYHVFVRGTVWREGKEIDSQHDACAK